MLNMREVWMEIPNFEEYEISNHGRLKLKHGAISNSNTTNICLRKNRKNHWFKRAQLILLAFEGPPKTKLEWNARHLDDNPKHNEYSNLAWGTDKDNYNDAVRNGTHGHNSPGAIIRGKKLKGKPRSAWVKQKISATKHAHPERMYKPKQDRTGRFVS